MRGEGARDAASWRVYSRGAGVRIHDERSVVFAEKVDEIAAGAAADVQHAHPGVKNCSWDWAMALIDHTVRSCDNQ